MAIIGITANLQRPMDRISYPNMALYYVEENVIKQVEKAGHTPIILPISDNLDEKLESFLKIVDGIILSGGTDISPELYNEELQNPNWSGDLKRDLFEINLLKKAKVKNIPVLGICRGFQLINVAYGGSLFQDIPSMRDNSFEHRNQEKYHNLTHSAKILKNTDLYEVIKKEELIINSVHHQGIKKLGENLEIMAYSDDGLIEAIKALDSKFVWGIQWHPEWLDDGEEAKKVLEIFFQLFTT
jgi:putative glutamine amidotransferase